MSITATPTAANPARARNRMRWALHLALRYLRTAVKLAFVYSPRGLGRLTARLAKWVYDSDSAALRHEHAGNRETSEYAKVHAVRKANLHARMLVLGSLAAILVGPILAWTFPYVLSAIVGAVVVAWIIKVIPGKSIWEVVAAIGAGVAVWWSLPRWLVLIPEPPAWIWWTLGAVGLVAFGWAGRPDDKPILKQTALPAHVVPPLRAPMVTEALCNIGIAGLKEPESIKLLMDVHRYGPGVQVDLELPGGVAAAEVVKRRERLAAALKRELGCVWPSVGRRHAAHLSLYVCDQPMVEAPQKPWPLADGAAVDIFQPLPQVTDQRGEWVKFTLAYAAVVIGAQPRMGKTFLLRQLLLAAGLDPRTKVYSLDGKGTGDLAPTRLFAHFYSVGDEPEEVEGRVLPALRELRAEMRRRAKFLRELPHEEAPESKVTSELATKYPHLAPVVVGIDETQAYFGYGDKSNKHHKAVRDELTAIVTDLAKRGPALGFITLLATQNVCEETIPRQISLNAVIRAALKVFDHTANDQILGTGAYSRGIDATAFDIDDKGLLWLRADGDQPQIVRSVAGLDVVRSEAIAAKARAIREAAGLLTGEAAGETAESEALQVDLLEDVRFVMDNEGAARMHLSTLLERLALLREGIYGRMNVDGLGAALRNAGVPTGQVKVDGRNTTGVKREHLNIAATSDVDPDDQADEDAA